MLERGLFFVIPAPEPESFYDGKFQDSGSSARNDGVFLSALIECWKWLAHLLIINYKVA